MDDTPAWVAADPEWAAALHVLDGRVLRRKDVRQWVDFDRRTIEFPTLLEAAGPWSHGERLLVQVAADLFNGSGETRLNELLQTLDDENLALVLEAIRLRRRW